MSERKQLMLGAAWGLAFEATVALFGWLLWMGWRM